MPSKFYWVLAYVDGYGTPYQSCHHWTIAYLVSLKTYMEYAFILRLHAAIIATKKKLVMAKKKNPHWKMYYFGKQNKKKTTVLFNFTTKKCTQCWHSNTLISFHYIQ